MEEAEVHLLSLMLLLVVELEELEEELQMESILVTVVSERVGADRDLSIFPVILAEQVEMELSFYLG